MTKHRSHSVAFKRQVAQEFIAGETLHALSKRHDISRQLIRIWVGKYETGALDVDAQAPITRARSKSSFARPYIWRLMSLSLVIWPSVWPLDQSSEKAASTAR